MRKSVPATKADIERWHKQVAAASAVMAHALARGKRSPTMINDVSAILKEVVDEMREKHD